MLAKRRVWGCEVLVLVEAEISEQHGELRAG
jgi:hypothetical protein